MKRPVLLDLFCGAGGAARGYQRAGFYVVGVDLEPQPHYAGDEFIQADALTFDLSGYDAVHASPVCKGYSPLAAMHPDKAYPLFLALVRERLQRQCAPWIIENVNTRKAPFQQRIVLCGTMFGLPIQRHRAFDSSHLLYAPGRHNHKLVRYGVYGHHCWDYSTEAPSQRKDGRRRPGYASLAQGREAMGIDWYMTQDGTSQAIPPAYTEWLGRQLIEIVRQAA